MRTQHGEGKSSNLEGQELPLAGYDDGGMIWRKEDVKDSSLAKEGNELTEGISTVQRRGVFC